MQALKGWTDSQITTAVRVLFNLGHTTISQHQIEEVLLLLIQHNGCTCKTGESCGICDPGG